MARKNPERERLIKQVMDRQRAAGKKVSRLKSQGVKLSGTKYDPRRPAENIRNYNTPQLKAHLNRLETFTSRKTRFAGDASGRPLPYDKWQTYKRAEAKHNKIIDTAFAEIKDIKAPGAGGLTIGQRRKVVTADRPSAGNPAVNPFTFVTRKSTAIKNEQALKKLTKALQKKLSTDFLGKELKEGRAEAEEMLKTLGQEKMQGDLAKMSDFHFNLLWNGTSFANDISTPYELYRKIMEGKGEAWHEEKLTENLKNAGELINAVKKIKLRR